MAVTQKVSVAMGRDELRLAKTAAREEGVSLSAYVTHAVRDRLEERLRTEAACEVLATFSPAEHATIEEQRELVALWTRTRAPIVRLTNRTGKALRRRKA
ncbi:MAG: hypothetical protein M3O46_21615 [Myxococcota bacterium]|nr:hypothetical protein [Myxococcota bacterium]